MKHDHDIAPILLTLEGRTEVKYEMELTPPEFQFIKGHCLMRTDIPILIVSLEREFANRSFDYEMIRRIKDKALNEKCGSNRTHLHALFIQGQDIRRHGGIFEVVPSCEDFGIESIHFQTATMRRYTIIYGVDDLKMVDGTHHLSTHKRTTIVWSVEGHGGIF